MQELDNRAPAPTQLAMLAELSRLGERSTRWLLRHRRRPLDIVETVSFFRAGVERVIVELPRLLRGADRDALDRTASKLREAGVPEGLA